MKRTLFPLVFVSLFIFPTSIYAHIPGQPSFFVVNGKYADFYPGTPNAFPNPDAPQDIGPEKYHVNQLIQFKIDTTKFPQATPEQIKRTKLNWKFGDGETASGYTNSHVYKKPGKYVLKILADDGTTPSPQLFESIEIEILPPKTSYIAYTIAGLLVIIVGIIGSTIVKKKKNQSAHTSF